MIIACSLLILLNIDCMFCFWINYDVNQRLLGSNDTNKKMIVYFYFPQSGFNLIQTFTIMTIRKKTSFCLGRLFLIQLCMLYTKKCFFISINVLFGSFIYWQMVFLSFAKKQNYLKRFLIAIRNWTALFRASTNTEDFPFEIQFSSVEYNMLKQF